jgi:hypothetical protein
MNFSLWMLLVCFARGGDGDQDAFFEVEVACFSMVQQVT